VGVVEAAGILEGRALFDAVEGGVLDWGGGGRGGEWWWERVGGGEEEEGSERERRKEEERSNESVERREASMGEKSFRSLSLALALFSLLSPPFLSRSRIQFEVTRSLGAESRENEGVKQAK